ncbi:MAG: biopolymer transporter ExbD [Candidatus Hydrogenedentes bacterium]|nr:biopolymer transporter ExbD [Candidatus Hydrogenedentota bacterium]
MKFKRNNKRRIVANVEMTPLIDVVFQLLIFFMLSSTFVVQTSIPIEIPKAPGANKLEVKDVDIFLRPGVGGPDNGGEIIVRGGDLQEDIQISEWAELSEFLSVIAERKPDALVLIYADDQTPSGRLVRVFGIANSVGIEKYGVAAESPGDV